MHSNRPLSPNQQDFDRALPADASEKKPSVESVRRTWQAVVTAKHLPPDQAEAGITLLAFLNVNQLDYISKYGKVHS